MKHTGTSDNRYTVPPLRDNEAQDPPVKGVLGTEKPKIIPGNWAAPKGTDPNRVEPGDPLTKDKSGNQPKNRNVFSRSFKVVLKSFYDRNRVLPDDKFWVWIVN
ncbi:hypothetical protein GCM10022419_108440 [Nonomuraea rosea]|uniref:Uncharacterized protein n=1 Tax=Nonomuraea rosea TaxID=638574 RepID=A0ABP6ZH00_9ACTN